MKKKHKKGINFDVSFHLIFYDDPLLQFYNLGSTWFCVAVIMCIWCSEGQSLSTRWTRQWHARNNPICRVYRVVGPATRDSWGQTSSEWSARTGQSLTTARPSLRRKRAIRLQCHLRRAFLSGFIGGILFAGSSATTQIGRVKGSPEIPDTSIPLKFEPYNYHPPPPPQQAKG